MKPPEVKNINSLIIFVPNILIILLSFIAQIHETQFDLYTTSPSIITYDTDTQHIEQTFQSELVPSSLMFHSATLINDKIWIVGGRQHFRLNYDLVMAKEKKFPLVLNMEEPVEQNVVEPRIVTFDVKTKVFENVLDKITGAG